MRRFFYDCEFMEEPGFLELISIGVVDESGKNLFYAVNDDADLSRANDWVKENVISRLPPRDKSLGHLGWMDRGKIKRDLLDFLMPSKDDPVELWGYYADYDHVLMCWIFGRMIDLPKGMPMYTLDIKQEMYMRGVAREMLPPAPEGVHNALEDAKWNRRAWLALNELRKDVER